MATKKETKEKYIGQMVRVVNGPYKDCEGEVTSVSGNKVSVITTDSDLVYSFFIDEVEII